MPNQIALTSFYGISHKTAQRLCARLQLHEAATVSTLNESQITELSAYLSSPGSIAARKPALTRPYPPTSSSSSSSSSSHDAKDLSQERFGRIPSSQLASPKEDPLRRIVIESDLKRQMLANIAHHRQIGTYRGRRHAQGLPVRGQRTQTNALTAKRLNRIERRGISTSAVGRSSAASAGNSGSRCAPDTITSLLRPFAAMRFGTSSKRPQL